MKNKNKLLELNESYLIETINGANVYLETIADYESLESCFSDCCSPAQIRGMYKRIENGNALFFSARVYCSVEVETHGQTHRIELDNDDYLGACFYNNLNEFLTGGYYEDMRGQVLTANNIH